MKKNQSIDKEIIILKIITFNINKERPFLIESTSLHPLIDQSEPIVSSVRNVREILVT